MSNYNIQINWSGKDALDDNDSDKVISGSDFNTEYTAVKTAVNSKANLNGDASEAFNCSTLTATTATATTTSTTNLNVGGTAVTSTAAEINLLDGKAFLDEDDMASDSATGIPSQQSVKAYVDSAITSTVNQSLSNLDATGEQKVAQAWVNFNGEDTPAIRDDYNVSSITDNGQGKWRINYTSNFANANYCPTIMTDESSSSAVNPRFTALATSYMDYEMRIGDAYRDTEYNCIVIHGDPS